MAYSVQGESSSSVDAFNSTPPCWKYDVFLSFAGKDTRLKFTDHLYAALTRGGIKTFRDEEGIERGGVVSHRNLQAIKDSLCAVVVLSGNYASSTWCLDELQMIIECRNKLGQRVFPIFYDVNPSDVRHHRKHFGTALAKYEERFRENKNKVQKWRNALYEISNLSGWDTKDRHEADLIKNVVGEVWNYLSSKLPSCDENLVGLGSNMANVMSYLEIGLDEVHFVGIWGMGGIGKTTLARATYEKISDEFEACCFLSNVRETSQREGIVSLQRKLLLPLIANNITIEDAHEGNKILQKLFSRKKVLLVLDDVDHLNQIQNLAQGPKWFGRGSRVIMTTRDSHLLTACNVQRIYEMEIMKKDESLQLFSIKAFNKNFPQMDYMELSESVVNYAGGLPLALEVLGSFLYGRSKAEWRDALDWLKQIPNNDILQILKISYDGLNDEEKTIFLDIACFFKGWPKKGVTQILESCGLHSKIGIKVLIEKALLVETKDHKFDMHDLLEDFGKYIVHQESPNVGKRSRLWKFEDIKEVLENNKGSEAIQAIVMLGYDGRKGQIEVYPEAFSKISNIRLLFIKGFRVNLHPSSLISPRRLRLSGGLKVVLWDSFPLETLLLETPLDKLVHIKMCFSKIKKLWNGRQSMKMLKYIDLSFCEDLTETPDFVGVPHLEYLCLAVCKSLAKVHPSLGRLKRLVVVDLRGCFDLEILPTKLETNSLLKLELSGCRKLAVLPEFGEGMKKLSYLDVSNNAVTTLPESLENLTGLRCLKLSCHRGLNRGKVLKTDIGCQIRDLKITSLTELYLPMCGLNDGSIPDDFVSLPSLIILDLSCNDFVNLPTSCFSSLSRLLFLSLDYCFRLKSLPKLPPHLVRLNASNCESMEALSSDRDHLWDLVASLDHELRGQTKYVISNDDDDYDDDTPSWVTNDFKNSQAEWVVPLRDFCAISTGSKIPSWFPNKECYPYHKEKRRGKYVIKVKIPPYLRDSEWSGIVVCLHFSSSSYPWSSGIGWSSKGAEDDDDDDDMYKQWAHATPLTSTSDNLCMMVLELNEKTCWRHLRGPNNNNSLHVTLSMYSVFGDVRMKGYGWRVISKEEIQRETCNDYHSGDLKQLTTQSHVDDVVTLPLRVLNTFICKVVDVSGEE